MKKQILKAFTMTSLVLLFTFAAAVASAQAQSRSRYTARIPFAFNVGGKALPAGEYTVVYETLRDGVVMLRINAEHKDGAIRLTQPVRGRSPMSKTTLVFNQYGEQYFLAEMWKAGDTQGRQLNKSGRERTVERELAQHRQQNNPAERAATTVEIIATLAK